MSNNMEGAAIAAMQIKATRAGWRIFRNMVGGAWAGVGKPIRCAGKPRTIVLAPGDVVLRKAHFLKFGLCEGSSDLIGWRPVVITPEMVGKVIAQFVAVEVKTEAYSRTTAAQDNFLDQVVQAGGFASIGRQEGVEVEVYPIDAE